MILNCYDNDDSYAFCVCEYDKDLTFFSPLVFEFSILDCVKMDGWMDEWLVGLDGRWRRFCLLIIIMMFDDQ